MVRRFWFPACALACATPTQAIVNVEDLRLGQPEQGFSASVEMAIDGETGNSEKISSTLGSRLQWQQQGATDFMVFNYSYGESQGLRDTNKAFLHGRHVQQQWQDIAWESFAQLESNEFTRLSFRGLLGTGLRLELAQAAPDRELFLGMGGFYSKETLDDEPGLSDGGSTIYWRANLYLSYKQRLNEQLHLISTSYYQPSLNEAGDYRILEQAAVQIKISQDLALKLALDITHDSRPPQTVDNTDTSYSTSLEYQF